MGLDCSVAAVFGFQIRKDQIVDTVEISSCEHFKPAGATFCPDCGVRVGVRTVDVDKVSRYGVVFKHLDGVQFGECSLISRQSSSDDQPSDDECYLIGITIGEATVVRESKAADISLSDINTALNKVMAVWPMFPGSPAPSLHLLPYASY